MAGSIRQSNFTDLGAPTGTSISLAFTSPCLQGNAIVVFSHQDSTTQFNAPATCTDNGGNSYSSALASAVDNVDHNSVRVFAAVNIAAGTPTVTVSWGANAPSFRGIYIAEIAGVTTDPANAAAAQYQNGPGTAPNAVKSGNATSTATCFMVGLSSQEHNTGDAPAVGSGFTLDKNGWQFGLGQNFMTAEFQASMPAGLNAATFTAPASTDTFDTAMVMLVEAPTGPKPPDFSQYYFAPQTPGGGGAAKKSLSPRAHSLMATSVLTRTLWEKGHISKEHHDKIIERVRRHLRGVPR